MDDPRDDDAWFARQADIAEQMTEEEIEAASRRARAARARGSWQDTAAAILSDDPGALERRMAELDASIYNLPDLNAQVLLGKLDSELWQVTLRSDGNIPEVAVRDREKIVQAVIDAIKELAE